LADYLKNHKWIGNYRHAIVAPPLRLLSSDFNPNKSICYRVASTRSVGGAAT
jgi:hypothetical protein